MALHSQFSSSPYEQLIPDQRWLPDAEELRSTAYTKLLRPLPLPPTPRPRLRISDTRPFRTENRPCLLVQESLSNRIVGEAKAGGLELAFAGFLETAPDVAVFAKNYFAVGFRIDYVRAGGDLSTYIPDFIVRTADDAIWFVETKGREELDLPQKMARLRQWCANATAADTLTRYDFVYVDQASFEKHPPATFAALAAAFTKYKD